MYGFDFSNYLRKFRRIASNFGHFYKIPKTAIPKTHDANKIYEALEIYETYKTHKAAPQRLYKQ